ncbi:TPA: hypothetical protein N0F65_001557 [Lagenidium giganteum]|uniref:glucan endo-1,3-beta-D-glucosidase n=1 Tax=Lagenidium giganteum TaxID=4803 RepID=A0AAV2YJ62_9STRA|nr:TPA: hypothetical protein N0F65_001557 [Lagenidium giganteum]
MDLTSDTSGHHAPARPKLFGREARGQTTPPKDQDLVSSGARTLHTVLALGAALVSAAFAADNGNVAACYSPMHNQEYPLHGGEPNKAALQYAIDRDFQIMSKNFTHVRTFYSQYYGTSPAKAAAAAGVKLYLGVYMTWDSWQSIEVDAAVQAVKDYPDTVEAILVGNENVHQVGSKLILEIVGQIKEGLGDLADKVKIGAVQHISEYLNGEFDEQTAELERELDILGVNIYSFFSAYDPANPASEVSKMRLTETGSPTDEAPSLTGVRPSLSESKSYYNAVKEWSPSAAESFQKLWFAFLFGVALVSSVLAADIGNVATCYSPFHLPEYLLKNNFEPDHAKLQAAMDKDFKTMSQHFTHVRTFYSQYYGTNPTKSAAAAGVKLYLGVFLTSSFWQEHEMNASIKAVQDYPDTVEAILVGNENLPTGEFSVARMLELVRRIKQRLGHLANKVKIGTVQRVSEYVNSAYDGQMAELNAELDILGVNIYLFFSTFNPKQPTAELERQWNAVKVKYPLSKLRLTETGFPTNGQRSPTGVKPNLNDSITYYNALKKWSPDGAESFPKFWFMAFDRHPNDNTMVGTYEHHFGFYTYLQKPRWLSRREPTPTPSPALTPAPTPVASNSTVSTPAPSGAGTNTSAPTLVPSPSLMDTTVPTPVPVDTNTTAPTTAPSPVTSLASVSTTAPIAAVVSTTAPIAAVVNTTALVLVLAPVDVNTSAPTTDPTTALVNTTSPAPTSSTAPSNSLSSTNDNQQQQSSKRHNNSLISGDGNSSHSIENPTSLLESSAPSSLLSSHKGNEGSKGNQQQPNKSKDDQTASATDNKSAASTSAASTKKRQQQQSTKRHNKQEQQQQARVHGIDFTTLAPSKTTSDDNSNNHSQGVPSKKDTDKPPSRNQEPGKQDQNTTSGNNNNNNNHSNNQGEPSKDSDKPSSGRSSSNNHNTTQGVPSKKDSDKPLNSNQKSGKHDDTPANSNNLVPGVNGTQLSIPATTTTKLDAVANKPSAGISSGAPPSVATPEASKTRAHVDPSDAKSVKVSTPTLTPSGDGKVNSIGNNTDTVASTASLSDAKPAAGAGPSSHKNDGSGRTPPNSRTGKTACKGLYVRH